MKSKTVNHYTWLDKHFLPFLKSINVQKPELYAGFIVAHGDKIEGYKGTLFASNIPFCHGCAMYLLTYIQPYSKQVRSINCGEGWVAPIDWVIREYPKFKQFLPEVDENDPEVQNIW